MADDLHRVEGVVCSLSSGNLDWDKRPIDFVIAHGLAGMSNPLGHAMGESLENPSSATTWNLVLILASKLMKRKGINEADARHNAWAGVEWWRNARCINCGGRGVIDKQQRQCPVCRGTGQRKMPESPAHVRDAIGLLLEAEIWMERQLSSSLRSCE